jgi:hypothetical protein
MSLSSFSSGITPASVSFVALRMIMNRIGNASCQVAVESSMSSSDYSRAGDHEIDKPDMN